MMARILLVEDNGQNVEIMQRLLKRQKHDVILAGYGAEAVTRAAADKPDLILMDIGLVEIAPPPGVPVIDGWEATRQIRANPETRAIPILALTAHAIVGTREHCLDAGCTDFVSKPFEFPVVLEKIKNLLNNPGTKP
jgi:two-component system, cell cycle response regulator DivK